MPNQADEAKGDRKGQANLHECRCIAHIYFDGVKHDESHRESPRLIDGESERTGEAGLLPGWQVLGREALLDGTQAMKCNGPGRCGGIASPTGRADGFKLKRVWEGSGGHPVLFASGYLTEGKDVWRKWRGLINNRFPRSSVYQVEWDCGEYQRLIRHTRYAAAAGHFVPVPIVPFLPVGGLAGLAVAKAAALAAPPLAYNARHWRLANASSREAGTALAACLEGHECHPALVGHSLGGALMVTAARTLDDGFRGLDSIHLLGAAIQVRETFTAAGMAADGRIFNYHSRDDAVLRALFRVGEAGQAAVGCVGARQPPVRDVDVTRAVGAHHGAYMGSILLR